MVLNTSQVLTKPFLLKVHDKAKNPVIYSSNSNQASIKVQVTRDKSFLPFYKPKHQNLSNNMKDKINLFRPKTIK